MPARVIRSEINSSDSLSRVSLEADLTFRALIVAVDDYGRMDARPHILKAELFPLRDELPPARVAELVAELAAIPNAPVALYEAEGRPYLQLTGWDRWRGNSRRANKSRFPEPPGDSRSVPEMRGNPPVNRESGVGSRESRSESREAATGGRSRARGEDQDRGQDHALTDAKRTDLDANPKRLTSHTATDAETIRRARDEHAPLFRRLRLAVQPDDRIRNDLVWDDGLGNATRDLADAESHCASPAEFTAALTWAMQDGGDGRFHGWKRVLSTPLKVAQKFAEGAVLEQYRASTESAKGGREDGDPTPPPPSAFSDGDRWRLDWPTPPGYLVASGRLRKIRDRRPPPTTAPSANGGAL